VKGNKREACRVLGISYHTLQAYLRSAQDPGEPVEPSREPVEPSREEEVDTARFLTAVEGA
jgi:hypothetical protein